MMTLRDLVERVNQMATDNPKLLDLPVYLRHKRTKRTTEYTPIRYCNGTLRVGDVLMVELTADADRSFVWPPRKSRKVKGS